MNERKFNQLPVVDGAGRYLGLIDVLDFLQAGFQEGA